MTLEQTIEERVVERLRALGFDAQYEYPGFVLLPDDDGSVWQTGTANPTWTIDHTSADGLDNFGGFDTYLDCERASVDAVVPVVLATLREADAHLRKISDVRHV